VQSRQLVFRLRQTCFRALDIVPRELEYCLQPNEISARFLQKALGFRYGVVSHEPYR
jgi:hypothetical protein